jgi:hypothetical protein
MLIRVVKILRSTSATQLRLVEGEKQQQNTHMTDSGSVI